jgi:chromate reductase
MSTPFRLLGISGSLRTGAYSSAILTALAEAAAPRASIAFADIGALPHYNQDLEGDATPAAVTDFKAQIAAADGVVLVSTEFNHGMPGVLKNALDWASRPAFRSPFKHKPVLIVTSSLAFTGGVRAQHQLRETLASMLARPVATPEIVIGLIRDKVVDGRLVDRAALDYSLNGFEALFEEIRLQAHAVNRPAAPAH